MALLDLEALPHPMDSVFYAKIPSYRIVEDSKHALYTIQITIDTHTWTLERRYRDFDLFDQQKFPDRSKSFLPPKKAVGNLDADFLTDRKLELEKYLKAILELEVWSQRRVNAHSLSVLVARFLDFHEYEIHAIVDDLSARLGQLGDGWLTASEKAPKYFEFTPIELYAVTERLKLAEPTISETNTSADLSNTLDFVSRVKNLKIRGSRGYVRSSNIVCNSLFLSLHYCKHLLSLWVADFDVSRIEGISHLRKTLRRLVIHYSMSSIRDFFIKEEPSVVDSKEPWQSLEEADFSFNHLEEIDDSICSLKALIRLNISQNRLTSIGSNLQHLPRLSFLDLSKNNIASVSGWSQLLGQISVLKIANNSIKSLEGLAKLYSLEVLDAGDNQLETIESVIFIGNLPCLEVLNLRGNKVRKVVEYRTRILEAFEERAGLVTLDGQPGDAHEKDTIAVRLALKKAREEKEMVDRERKEKIERSVRYISGCEGSDTSPYGSFRNTL